MHRRRKTRRWYSTTETAVSSAWKTAIVVNHANCWVDYSRRYAGTSATFPHDDKCWALFIKWMENNFHLNHSFWFIWLNAGKCGWGQSSALFVVYCQLARVLFFFKKRVTHTIEEGKGWWASIMIVFPARKKKMFIQKKKKKKLKLLIEKKVEFESSEEDILWPVKCKSFNCKLLIILCNSLPSLVLYGNVIIPCGILECMTKADRKRCLLMIMNIIIVAFMLFDLEVQESWPPPSSTKW